MTEEPQRYSPGGSERGFAVFFTGLPAAGKSTLASALSTKLVELGGRPVSLLDGDVVRRHLSADLGFSKVDRDINVRRIGHAACEIVRSGGSAICAQIAPYDPVRKEVRAMLSAAGGFLLSKNEQPEWKEEGDWRDEFELD